MTTEQRFQFDAGVVDGHEMRAWSQHRTEEAAKRAARKYARDSQKYGPHAGGAGQWSSFWRRKCGPWHEVLG
jgi:hypothetical protein